MRLHSRDLPIPTSMGNGTIVTNYGPGTVTYSASPLGADGTIAPAATVTLAGSQYLSTTSAADVTLSGSPATDTRADPTRAGFWATPNGVPPTSAFAVSDGIMYATRFVPGATKTIAGGALAIQLTAGQDDAVDIGIYQASTGGARLGSTGTVTGKLNVTGHTYAALTAPVTLAKGTPYIAAIATAKGAGAGATIAAAIIGASADVWKTGADGATFDTSSAEFAYAVLGAALLPATLPALTANSTSVSVAWREA